MVGKAAGKWDSQKKRRRRLELLAAWNRVRSQASEGARGFFSDVDGRTLAPLVLVSLLAVTAFAVPLVCVFQPECQHPNLLHQLSGHLSGLHGLERAPFCLFGPYKSCDTATLVGDWSEWGECNVKCGRGNMTRTRVQTSLPGGKAVQIGSCSATEICLDMLVFAWTDWSPWGKCSATCGPSGIHDRTRQCQETTMAAAAHPSNCPGVNGERRQCNKDVDCPSTYLWARWTSWGGCHPTCGKVRRKDRSRECQTEKAVAGNTSHCVGSAIESQSCPSDFCDYYGAYD